MSRNMRIATGNLCLTLATMLSAMAAGVCAAADAPATPVAPAPLAAQQPVQDLDQLDEIWVRGKHLSGVIEDAEDEFFKRYNKLNRDSSYHIYCGRMSLNNGSMVMVRRCLPGFIVFNSYDYRTNTVSFGQPGFGSACSGNMYPQRETNGDIYYMSSCNYSGYSGGSAYVSPPSGLLMMERRPAYLKNVLKVVSSDSRLLEMARNLGGLYNEMESVQNRYVKVRAVERAARPGKSSRSKAGPRTM